LGSLIGVLTEVAPKQNSDTQRQTTPAKVRWLYFLVLPALFLVLHLIFVRAQGPFFLGSNIDPDYAYLFNSLNIATGKSPQHVDHPGTTVQVLGGLVLRLAHPFSSHAEIIEAVLKDPERHLHWINFTWAVIYAASLSFIGVLVWLRSGRWLSAVLLQAAPFLLGELFRVVARVNPDPMLILSGILLAATLYLKSLRERSCFRGVCGLGFLAALGIATKLSFVPLPLAALACLRTWKERAAYLGCAGFFTCLLLIPLVPQAERHLRWVQSLIVHERHYGQGGTGFLPPEYFSNLGRLVTANPWTCTLIAASWVLAVYALRRCRKQPSAQVRRWSLLLAGLTAAQTLQMLMVVKYASWRYLLPMLAFCPLNIVLLLEIAGLIWGNRSWWLRPRWLHVALLCVALTIFGAKIKEQYDTLAQRHADRMRMARVLQGEFKDQTQVYYWGASSLYHALWFGNHYAGQHYTPALKEIFQSHAPAYLADQHTGALYWLGKRKSSLAQLGPGHPPLLLVGATRSAPLTLSHLPPHAKAEQLLKSGQEVMHRVTFGANEHRTPIESGQASNIER
jgi:hypothetical protein